MFEFHEKRKLFRFLHSPLFFGILLILVCSTLTAAYRSYGTERAVYAHRQELEQQLATLTEKRKELEKNVSRLDDPQGIEAELRKRYGVGREGEEAIILVEEESKQAVVAETRTEAVGVWKSILAFFQ